MKIQDLKLKLIFFDNPISRFYINFLKNYDFLSEIIILSEYFFFKKIFAMKKFIKNNNYPILFLKNKKNSYLINFVEEYFNLEKNFIYESYKFQTLDNFKLKYVNSNSINSREALNYFIKYSGENFLYTGKEIIKKSLFNTKKNFFHFHPGYLPEMRGADISIRSVFYKKQIGCTFFKINDKIDQGEILLREKADIDIKYFKILKDLKFKDFYKFWYSFIDPSIRLNLLKKIVLNKTNLTSNEAKVLSEESNYFSFLSQIEIQEIYNSL